MKVKAYAAKNEKGLLEPYEYELGEIGPDDVDIEIENCGLCYSDVHYIDNDFSNNVQTRKKELEPSSIYAHFNWVFDEMQKYEVHLNTKQKYDIARKLETLENKY